MKVRVLLAGIAGATLMAATANAADVVPVIPTVAPVIVEVAEPGFDWSGFYAGVLAGVFMPAEDPSLSIGGIAGFNATAGRFLYGLDLSLYPTFFDGIGGDYTNLEGTARARFGVTLGAEDRLLLYGALGPGFYHNLNGDDESGWYLTPSVGMELALGDHLSLRASLDALSYPGSLLTFVQTQITGGLIWHFGN